MNKRLWLLMFALMIPTAHNAHAAATQKRYYAHDAVEDKYGVIAPWYRGQNGQLDYRIRIAAETLKRYPWTDTKRAVAALPEYMFSSSWRIAPDGTISVPPIENWANGDLGQRSAYVLSGLVDYYAYSGDPAAIAHMTWMADFLIDYCQTPADHPWPKFLISVPTKGKPYGQADPKGHIQLDITAEVGLGLLRAYQVTYEDRWLDTAKHWGDLLAEHCNRTPGAMPWPRYANPQDTPWPTENRLTGGVAFILYFMDELIRLGYSGKDNAIVTARDAGRAYLRDTLLPKWTVNDTFGINYWDWPSPVQLENVTEFAARYMMDNKGYFPNWRTDVRNILTLFLNHTSVDANSGGEVYSGAWAYPESSGCCGRSLWYGPMEVAWAFAQYGVEADSEWAREIARRSQILATYDIHDTGYSEDGIDGGPIVNGEWFKIAHPMALKHLLATMGWMPELFGPSHENHIVRSSAVISDVFYGKGNVQFWTYRTPANTVTVLRLSFVPKSVEAGSHTLSARRDLGGNGYTVRRLADGDCIVTIRHDGEGDVRVAGVDQQQVISCDDLVYSGEWVRDVATTMAGLNREAAEAGASASCKFTGNQVRVIGRAGRYGGQADVYLDGVKQRVGIDSYNEEERGRGVLFYANGLENKSHELRVVLAGKYDPYSRGSGLAISEIQYCAATATSAYGEGGGPKGAQRVILGYPKREDYKDSDGNTWRPGTEFVVRLGTIVDSVEKSWWQTPAAEPIAETKDAELYRYGVHAPEFVVNFTVGPGKYHARLKFAATRNVNDPISVEINGVPFLSNVDVAATAGGAKRAVDLVANNIAPRNGVIDIRFKGALRTDGDCVMRKEAFVQAIEIGPGDGGKGAVPVTATVPVGPINLIVNPGFENGIGGDLGGSGKEGGNNGWTYLFASPGQSYIWPESDYSIHPDWGLPELHCGVQATRTHSDANGHTLIYQDVALKPGVRYAASAWVRAADLRGKGFGKTAGDSAGIIIQEMNKDGKVIVEHPKVEIRDAGPFRKVVNTFRTDPSTAKVRFVLDTVIGGPYNEGHVTYDDCALVEGK